MSQDERCIVKAGPVRFAGVKIFKIDAQFWLSISPLVCFVFTQRIFQLQSGDTHTLRPLPFSREANIQKRSHSQLSNTRVVWDLSNLDMEFTKAFTSLENVAITK